MFTAVEPLREPLLAARLLREEILRAPVRADARGPLRELVRAASGDAWPAVRRAAELGVGTDVGVITAGALREIAAAVGPGGRRSGPGEPFHGRPAPAATETERLLGEVLETVNAPRAAEAWSPVVRAFALHFLLRLVQPFAAPPAVVGVAAEALVLAADGFDARVMGLGAAPSVGAPHEGRPDPDGFALARANALVEGLSSTRDALHEATARAVLAAWSSVREAGLNRRQQSVLEWLSRPGRSLAFSEYVRFHDGRAGPSLRSLQRDWRGLREAGWIVPGGEGRWRLSTAPLEWGGSVVAGAAGAAAGSGARGRNDA